VECPVGTRVTPSRANLSPHHLPTHDLKTSTSAAESICSFGSRIGFHRFGNPTATVIIRQPPETYSSTSNTTRDKAGWGLRMPSNRQPCQGQASFIRPTNSRWPHKTRARPPGGARPRLLPPTASRAMFPNAGQLLLPRYQMLHNVTTFCPIPLAPGKASRPRVYHLSRRVMFASGLLHRLTGIDRVSLRAHHPFCILLGCDPKTLACTPTT